MLVYEFVSRNVAYRIDLSNLSLLFNNDRDLEEIFLLVLATTLQKPAVDCVEALRRGTKTIRGIKNMSYQERLTECTA